MDEKQKLYEEPAAREPSGTEAGTPEPAVDGTKPAPDGTPEDTLPTGFPKPKGAQTDFSHGVATDDYDTEPEMQAPTAEEEDELAGREHVRAEYSFNGEEIREGLTVFQKETLYKKNLIYTGVLLLIFLLYVISIFRVPTQGLYYFLAVLCLAVIGFVWYQPRRHIKKTAAAVEESDMQFVMEIYDDCVRIDSIPEGNGVILHFGKELTRVIETPALYLFCAGKERLFVLPKRYLDVAAEEKIRTFVTAALKEKYKRIPAEPAAGDVPAAPDGQ